MEKHKSVIQTGCFAVFIRKT